MLVTAALKLILPPISPTIALYRMSGYPLDGHDELCPAPLRTRRNPVTFPVSTTSFAKTLSAAFLTFRLRISWACVAIASSVAISPSWAADAPPLSLVNGRAGWRAHIHPTFGHITALEVRHNGRWEGVPFRKDQYAGPSWRGVQLHLADADNLQFAGQVGDVHYSLQYASVADRLTLIAGIRNDGSATFAPTKASLTLGIDSFMNNSSRWNNQFFPTLLHCEPTHCWGYFMSPNGHILGVSSPDPVGSYSYDYLEKMYAHQIYTATLDLLQQPPVPDHHPVYRPLSPGETRTWHVVLQAIDNFDAVPHALAKTCNAPMIDLDVYSVEPKQTVQIRIDSPTPLSVLEVTNPAGVTTRLKAKTPTSTDSRLSTVYTASLDSTESCGRYIVRAKDRAGKRSEASFFVHPPWSWYMKQARSEAIRHTPRADQTPGCGADAYSCETHYGLVAFSLARRYFPDNSLDTLGDQILEKIASRFYQREDGRRFSRNRERIQNGAFMADVYVARYWATGDMASLETAEDFVEYLLSRQHAKGYYGGYGMHPYTAVIYPAKTIMGLMGVERRLATAEPKWQTRYDRHLTSVRRAMDDLLARGLNMPTEGDATFEDGAISCSAAQLAMFALIQTDDKERKKYLEGAKVFFDAHRCLTRLHDTDCRSRGATERYWEAWGDIHATQQMMLAPHGWSGWKTYANYYLYLLTGEETYLRQTINSIGSITQLIDWPKGELRYAFLVDPRITGTVLVPDGKRRDGQQVRKTLGEQYLPGIGDWYGRTTVGDSPLDRVDWKWQGDGCAIEGIKAMAEIVLAQAYVLQRADGSLFTWNCRASLRNAHGLLTIETSEDVVSRIHLNLREPCKVLARFFGGRKEVSGGYSPGMHWIGPGGEPEELQMK
jgi:hypothetical protein